MNSLIKLQNWYQSQCNEDWEHSYGIKIDNIDNPGWAVKIDLTETELEHVKFPEISYGIGDNADSSRDDWMLCRRVDNVFAGFGGPHKLDDVLEIFLEWANQNQPTD